MLGDQKSVPNYSAVHEIHIDNVSCPTDNSARPPHASTDDRHAEITMHRLSNRNDTFTNIATVYTFDSV